MNERQVRNAAIAADFQAGLTYHQLVDKYAVSRRTVVDAIKSQGAQVGMDARRKRQQIAGARKVMFADEPEKRKEYLRIRAKVGAGHARYFMGLADAPNTTGNV